MRRLQATGEAAAFIKRVTAVDSVTSFPLDTSIDDTYRFQRQARLTKKRLSRGENPVYSTQLAQASPGWLRRAAAPEILHKAACWRWRQYLPTTMRMEPRGRICFLLLCLWIQEKFDAVMLCHLSMRCSEPILSLAGGTVQKHGQLVSVPPPPGVEVT